MAKSKEIVIVPEAPQLVEIDGRHSGETYYQLVWCVGTTALALLAREPHETRAVPVDSAKGNDAMTHPEAPYLASDDVIYGGGYEDLIVDYGEIHRPEQLEP